MFTNLIFLILMLLMVSLVGELPPHSWSISPPIAFAIGMTVYVLLLILIHFQRRVLKESSVQTVTALELIVFFMFFYFILGAHRFLADMPLLSSSQTPLVLFSLLLYMGGITLVSSSRQFRLIIPFALPFVFFTLLADLLPLIPIESFQKILSQDTEFNSLLLLLASLVFMGLMMVFLPPLIIRIWQCRPMKDSPLKQRLEQLCEKAEFKHGGILDWTILNNSLTAAIVGIAPRFRYVMFTKRIQKDLTPDSLEAILAHEIGHSYHKHLLIYPFILFGMIICTGLFSLFFADAMEKWFLIRQTFQPSELWDILYPIAIFIPYALIIALYFRFVFGYFSRLFERQADLHGFKLGLSPEHMIHALDDVAIATGFTHLVPNWHHHSIQDRIDFLNSATLDPGVIDKHHQRVRRALFFYFILLIIGCLLVFSPFLPAVPPFNEMTEMTSWISKKIANLVI